MRVDQESALCLATRLLEERGTPLEHARLQARVLFEGELKGHPSHGLQRLPRILARIERTLIDPASAGRSHWRSSSFLEVDGMKGLGPVVACAALEHLADRTRQAGVAVAGIRNSNHLGMLAYYVERLADKGLIGLAMSSSEALVHPYGGTQALLGTNPLAIAIPTADRPMVIDLATGIVSMGKIHHHAANGSPIPRGWARDADGRSTTDATAATKGSIAPFGEAKGYALGMALELMVASVAKSALAPNVRGTLDANALCNKGDVLIAIDIGEQPEMLASFTTYLNGVRNSLPADPARPVTVPGDGALARREEALSSGIAISPRLWDELNALSYSSKPLVKGHGQ
ncbi:Ldh family oxidoreductase [Rhizobium sp. 2MFCol3.1]|uniref:Ldh family oxidoreductase n=1 Tax=Rhizobium sp. 2MFCol3.1 TaxID=1246459 RepID=UPI0004780A49|nr:Ldh family oxidoreductase [Rhizobium sp. 2MFCol3.1]